jgi:hypothetical protein
MTESGTPTPTEGPNMPDPTLPPSLQPRRGWRALHPSEVAYNALLVALSTATGVALLVLLPDDASRNLAVAAVAAVAIAFFVAVERGDDIFGRWQPSAEEVELWRARQKLDWHGFLPAAADATVLDGVEVAIGERRRLQALLDWNDIPRSTDQLPEWLRDADVRQADRISAEVARLDLTITRLQARAAQVADEAIGEFMARILAGDDRPTAQAAAVHAVYDRSRAAVDLLGGPSSTAR